MAIDFNTALGLRPGDGPGTLVLEPRPEHQVAPDVVHFAVLTTLAEFAAAGTVGAPVVPASITVHLLSAPASRHWWVTAAYCARENGWRWRKERSLRTAGSSPKRRCNSRFWAENVTDCWTRGIERVSISEQFGAWHSSCVSFSPVSAGRLRGEATGAPEGGWR